MAVMVADRGFDHERYAAMFLWEDLCFVCNTHDKMGDVRYVPVTIHAVLLLDGDKMQKKCKHQQQQILLHMLMTVNCC